MGLLVKYKYFKRVTSSYVINSVPFYSVIYVVKTPNKVTSRQDTKPAEEL